MPKLIDDVLVEMNVTGTSKMPHTSGLYDVDAESPPLDPVRARKFYSIVYKLYYAAIRVETRIQVAIHFLTTRVTKSTEEDWKKLMKVLQFLNGTERSELLLKPDDGPLRAEWLVDVGYAVHADMRSQTGSVGRLNGATIYVRTSKQKCISKSSSESEMRGVADEAGVPHWVNRFLRSLGFAPDSIALREDNTAAIMLHTNGRSTSARTRHIAISEFWLKQYIDSGEITFEWIGGENQIADALSKPVVGRVFVKHFDAIHGVALKYKSQK
jgi:hypothetical protein